MERNLAPATIKAYVSDLKHLAMVIGNKPVASITLDDLRSWQRQLALDGKSPATIRRRIHSLNTWYYYLKLSNLVDDEISRKLHTPKKHRRSVNVLTAQQLKIFVTTPSSLKIAWLMMAWLGLRRSELIGVLWEDVGWASKTITLRATKNGDDKTMPLSDELYVALVAYHIAAGQPSSGMIFDWLSKDLVYREFNKHLANCGLEGKGITPHTIRHTFATLMYQNGADIASISRLLGHKRISTTLDMYIHTNTDMLRSVLNDYHPLANE